MEQAPAINFSTALEPGETKSVEHRFTTSGVVERLHTTAYAGEETDVRRYFYLWQGGKDGGHRVNLLTTASYGDVSANEYLAGDDQIWDLETRREFTESDVLEVKYVNTDTQYGYPVDSVVEVDHAGGVAGILGRFL